MSPAEEYHDVLKKHLQASEAAHLHNLEVVTKFQASVQPVNCIDIYLPNGTRLVTLGLDDGYWLVVEGQKIKRWIFGATLGVSAEYTVSSDEGIPEEGSWPFFNQWLSLSDYRASGSVRLLAGTNVDQVMATLIEQMIELPAAPAHPEGMLWPEAYEIAMNVEHELEIEKADSY